MNDFLGHHEKYLRSRQCLSNTKHEPVKIIVVYTIVLMIDPEELRKAEVGFPPFALYSILWRVFKET